MAAVRGHADVAVGNVVGSNIFNILGILGVTALVRPIGVAAHMASLDVWVMLGAGVIGYVMRKFGYEPAPLVVGLVLGPVMESRGVKPVDFDTLLRESDFISVHTPLTSETGNMFGYGP